MSSRFSTNSEADASELVENLEEMFFRYSMHNVTGSYIQLHYVESPN